MPVFTFFHGNESVLIEGLFDGAGELSLEVLSASATAIVLRNTVTGLQTTVTGTGLSGNATEGLTGGTITGVSFGLAGVLQSTLTGISWDAEAFMAAVGAVHAENSFAPLAVFAGDEPLIVNVGAMSDGFGGSELTTL